MSSTSTDAITQTTTTTGAGSILGAGVLSGALFASGYLLSGYIPGGGQTDAKSVTDFYNGTSTGTAYLLFFGLLAAAVCLIWFFTLLGTRLGESNQTYVGVRLATIGTALLIAGGAIMLAPLSAMKISGADFVGVPTAIAFAQAGLGVMVIGGVWMLATAAIMLSWHARRVDAYPAWLSWAGLTLGVLSLGSVLWAPGILLAVWFVLVGVGLRAKDL